MIVRIAPLLQYRCLRYWRHASYLYLGLFALGAHAQTFTLTLDDVTGPGFALTRLQAQVDLAQQSKFTLTIGEARLQERSWRDVRLVCGRLALSSGLIECAQGSFLDGEKIPFTFSYRQKSSGFLLNLLPAAGERWQLSAISAAAKTLVSLQIQRGKLSRINPWLPANAIQFTHGALDAQAQANLVRGAAQDLALTAKFSDIAFSDAAGAHAADKFGAMLTLNARYADTWQWHGQVDWLAGEIYWQPFYFAPGVRHLTAHGNLTPSELAFTQAQLDWIGIGKINAQGAWDRVGNRITRLEADGQDLALKDVYAVFLKPLAGEGPISKLQWSGRADARMSMQAGSITETSATLRDAGVKQDEALFAFSGLNANLAWSPRAARDNRIDITGGTLGKIPLGKFGLHIAVAPERISVAPVAVPILDGSLQLDGIDATRLNQDWQWTVSAALRPISMQRLTEALQLPLMHGSLSAVIPRVHYQNQNLTVDGALLFKVFDGTIVVKDLSGHDLGGLAPHVQANVDMRNLDLDLLTRTFSFGAMQGRVDVTVHDLELFGWRPVQFDAKVASSPGDYPRKISQRAVENITALSGGGGAAALQRSFLRFFDQFGYARIGLSCRLQKGVCQMGGIENTAQGYLIVQGGGIPSLSVIGYNRQVGWEELLARIKAATQGGTPIVR